jgi:uncharacterized protein YecE (DUF72 family)
LRWHVAQHGGVRKDDRQPVVEIMCDGARDATLRLEFVFHLTVWRLARWHPDSKFAKCFCRAHLSPMRHFVGTSGFAYKEWKGIFYPEKIKSDAMLEFYASKLPSVEINNTFYRMPAPEMLQSWAARVPAAFRFVLKAPKTITHIKRLNDIAQPLEAFLERSTALKEKLGGYLFQLPPNMKKDAARLSECLSLLPKGTRAAFEFRNATWFDEEIYTLLRTHKQALCLAESDDLHTPFVATAPFGYLRLRELDYTPQDLAARAEQIKAQPWDETFVFFKHEDGGLGSQFALNLTAALSDSSRGP